MDQKQIGILEKALDKYNFLCFEESVKGGLKKKFRPKMPEDEFNKLMVILRIFEEKKGRIHNKEKFKCLSEGLCEIKSYQIRLF